MTTALESLQAVDARINAAEHKLRPLLTDEVLEVMRLAVKTCGHSVDHVESSEFVRWCFDVADKERPDTEPYDYY